MPAASVAPVTAPSRGAPAETADDPARVVGRWRYRTRSNCGRVEGVGEVSFEWQAASNSYAEAGHVYWADSGVTITWQARDHFDRDRRTLSGRASNSLGDTVEATWQLAGGPPPDRLAIVWTQTNGCTGEGTATRE